MAERRWTGAGPSYEALLGTLLDVLEQHGGTGRLAAAAVERSVGDAQALALHGYIVGYTRRDFEGATTLLRQALKAGPNCSLAWMFSGLVHGWRGEGRDAIRCAEQSLRLSPFDPFATLFNLAKLQHEGAILVP